MGDRTAGRLARLPGTRRLTAVSAGTGAAAAGLVVAQAELLAVVLTGPSAANVVALAGVLGAGAALSWIRGRLVTSAAATVTGAVRARLADAISGLGPVRLRAERGGELATLAGPGLDGLDTYLTEYLPQRVPAVLVPLAVLAAVVAADPLSAVAIALTLPLIPVFGALAGWYTRSAAAGQWGKLAELGGHFLDVVRGLPTLRAFGRSGHQIGVVERTAEAYRGATMRTLRIAFLSGLALDLVTTLSVALVAVPIGFRLLDGTLGLRTGLLVLLLAPEAYKPLRDLGSAFHAAAAGRAAADRAFAVIDEARSQASAPVAEDQSLPSGPGRAVSSEVLIRLSGAEVRFPGAADPVLRDVELCVRPGERIALVGPSGAGKSSLLAVLLGFLPATGSVHLGGTPLDDLLADPAALAAWHSRLAWVGQRPHLFAGTIADNIALGDPAATPDRVRAAARAACADDFIDALPDGYATLLGERGVGLSVGQRQRVALARAFLVDAPLLLLDEPTAGLDAGSELAVATATRRLMAGRTVVLATHRPALLSDVDRVFRVADGRVWADAEAGVPAG